MRTRKTLLKAVDFFCSGGGMTYGLSKAGIRVIAGIDNDVTCKDTYEINNPDSLFILADVFQLKEVELQDRLQLKRNDDNLILVGCSPCQYWSTLRTDKTKSEKSKNLLKEFERFVIHFNPGYVLVENVPGILTKRELSGLDVFLKNLTNMGYKVHYEIVNMNKYGVPQSRKRFSLLATRLHKKSIFPIPKYEEGPVLFDIIGKHNGFPKVHSGNIDRTQFYHTTAFLTKKNIRRLKKTPSNGGSWLSWAENKSLKRRSYVGKGFIDNYGRMSWRKPSPTLTTKFHSISNGRFAHPEEHRGISIREGASIQTFPKSYKFRCKNSGIAARIIGNAVPPLFAKKLGAYILKEHKRRR